MNRAVRGIVYRRDGYQCVACGRSDTLTIHHRKNRGMGGAKLLDGFANLLTLCCLHNQRLESDVDFADMGRVYGWKLRQWQDPLKVPVSYPDGYYYLLTDHGEKIRKANNDS